MNKQEKKTLAENIERRRKLDKKKQAERDSDVIKIGRKCFTRGALKQKLQLKEDSIYSNFEFEPFNFDIFEIDELIADLMMVVALRSKLGRD